MTTRLNLLPWREMRRKEQDKQLMSVAGFAWVLMALIVFYGHVHVTTLIDNQNKRNQYLEEEIVKVDKQIAEIKELQKQRKALIARMNIIYELQGDRTQIVHVFDEFVQRLPDGVYFTNMDQKGKNFFLNGVAQSNARVSALMRNLEESNWFKDPVLEIIKAKETKEDRVSEFKLRVTQTDKRAKKSEGPGS